MSADGLSKCPMCKERAGRMYCRPGSASIGYRFIVMCTQCGYKTDEYALGADARRAWEERREPDELHQTAARV